MVASALVVTHTPTEGVGTFGDWLPAAGLDLEVLQPWAGDALPTTLAGHDALLVMGGPQQAYDDDCAPWLRATKELLRQAVEHQVPALGICLGGQLLAQATGGRVRPSPQGPELGARLVAMRDVAKGDLLLHDLPMSPVVVQWHWDEVVDLPPGAVLLASSPRCPVQAFRVGERAWGLQFHLETPPDMVRAWAAQDAGAVLTAGLDPALVADHAVAALPELAEVWRPVLTRWAGLAQPPVGEAGQHD